MTLVNKRDLVTAVLLALALGFSLFAAVRSLVLVVFVSAFAFALTYSVLITRRKRSAIQNGKRVPAIIEALAAQLSSGASLIEALDLGRQALPERDARYLAEVCAIFERDCSLEERISAAKAVLPSRETDLLFEVLFIAARNGDDRIVNTLNRLAARYRRQHGLEDELLARQGWILGSARLAQASPWIVVVLLSVRPETANAFQSPQGALVLALGAALSLTAQRFISVGARLPAAQRVLRV